MRPEKIQGNVFVASLPNGMTDEQLAELFDPYGIVLRAYLARDPATGATLGHGLVQLAPERVLDAAIAGVNGTVIGGRTVDVRRADPDMSVVPHRHRETPPPRPAQSSRPALVVERVPAWSRLTPANGSARLGLTGTGRHHRI